MFATVFNMMSFAALKSLSKTSRKVYSCKFYEILPNRYVIDIRDLDSSMRSLSIPLCLVNPRNTPKIHFGFLKVLL